MNISNPIDSILARHFSGEELTVEERRELEAYQASHAEEYRKIESMVGSLSERPRPILVDTGKAWEQVASRLGLGAGRPLLRRLAPWLAVAASLMLLVGIGWALMGESAAADELRYANQGTRDTTLLLPDGSSITLAPFAEAVFAEQGTDRMRHVDLQGKATFDVKHNGQPFRVDAGRLRVDVLGTVFSVDAASEDHGHVVVKSGRVQVSLGHQSVELTAGEQVDVDNGTIGHKHQSQPAAAKIHVFSFDNTQVGEAAEEVGKAFDVRIDVDASIATANRVTTRMEVTSPMQALREFALLCGCRCDSVAPMRYRLRR